MDKKPNRAVALAAGCLLFASALFGCGDKFVVLGRSARFQRINASAHPASILIYRNPASRLPAEKDFPLESTLKLAGHKSRVVETPADVGKSLTSGSYDIVLTDFSDVSVVEPQVKTAASKSSVIPMLYNQTSAEIAAVEGKYSCVLKASKKSHDLLAVIDEAMTSKLKTGAADCPKTR
jgi:hypothetical protein